ncbi:MAG TPA: hypothetical protein VIX80_02430 [Candidatus Kapabacteria bacterium]
MPSEPSFIFRTDAAILCSALVVLMLIAVYLGYKVADWKRKRNSSAGDEGSSAVFGSLLGLLGLLLAFTFGMSGSRFDDRRKVITEEANDIGTAILRCDLFPDSIRHELRKEFKGYVESRIQYMEVGTDLEAVKRSLEQKDIHAAKIWGIVTKYAKENSTSYIQTNLAVPALNDMFDVTTKRLALDSARVPDLITTMLLMISIICSFYGGYTIGRKGKVDWLLAGGFTLIIATVIFTTLDLERSRRGITNLNANNKYIIQLRDMVKEP